MKITHYSSDWWILAGSTVIVSKDGRNYAYCVREAVIDEYTNCTVITRCGLEGNQFSLENKNRVDVDIYHPFTPWNLCSDEDGANSKIAQIYDQIESGRVWQQSESDAWTDVITEMVAAGKIGVSPVFFNVCFTGVDKDGCILRSDPIVKLIPIGGEVIAKTKNGAYLLRGKASRKEARA